jgi:Tfp pilus assembly protein PilN
MPQQINLLTPILLAPRRHFSALAMLQASGLLLLAGLLVSLWLQHQDRRAEAQHQALLARFATERQTLQVARAALPPPADAAVQEQQLQALEAGNRDRAQLLLALDGGVGAPGLRHSDLLALVARSLPEAAWLTELRFAPGRLELVGGTLDTTALRPWLSQLAAHPLLAGQDLASLRVERLGAHGTAADAAPLLARSETLAATALPVWAFRVVSAPAPTGNAASGASR